MSPEDRHEAEEVVRHVIFPLVYSARRRLQDRDHEGLQVKIDWTLEELLEVACGLRSRGYSKAA